MTDNPWEEFETVPIKSQVQAYQPATWDYTLHHALHPEKLPMKLSGLSSVMLDFEESTHKFEHKGLVIPSVTQLLKEAGITPDYSLFSNTKALRIGNAVHMATSLSDEERLDTQSISTPIVPYMTAWSAYRDAHKPIKIMANESSFVREDFSLVGTPDRIVLQEITGVEHYVVEEIKTGEAAPWHFAQLAGYMALVGVPTGRIVYLRSDGSFKPNHLDWGADKCTKAFRGFLGAHQVWKFKRRRG